LLRDLSPTYKRFITNQLYRFYSKNTVLNRAKWDDKFKKLLTESCDLGWFLNPVNEPVYVFPTSGMQILHRTKSEIKDWFAASLCDASKKFIKICQMPGMDLLIQKKSKGNQ